MTNFYSPETCKQLQQLGCVASSGIGYFLHERYLENGEPKSYVTYKEYELAPIENAQFYTYDYLVLPAFFPGDFTASPEAKENCIKLWGEEKVCCQCGVLINEFAKTERHDDYFTGEIEVFSECTKCYSPIDSEDYMPMVNSYYKAHRLLDIILSGSDGESFIKEALGKK